MTMNLYLSHKIAAAAATTTRTKSSSSGGGGGGGGSIGDAPRNGSGGSDRDSALCSTM